MTTKRICVFTNSRLVMNINILAILIGWSRC